MSLIPPRTLITRSGLSRIGGVLLSSPPLLAGLFSFPPTLLLYLLITPSLPYIYDLCPHSPDVIGCPEFHEFNSPRWVPILNSMPLSSQESISHSHWILCEPSPSPLSKKISKKKRYPDPPDLVREDEFISFFLLTFHNLSPSRFPVGLPVSTTSAKHFLPKHCTLSIVRFPVLICWSECVPVSPNDSEVRSNRQSRSWVNRPRLTRFMGGFSGWLRPFARTNNLSAPLFFLFAISQNHVFHPKVSQRQP